MARRLGVDYDESFLSPPTTDEALALDTYRCGQSLLMAFTYPDGWPRPPFLDRQHAKRARKAARLVRGALLTERGPNAISYMTQGYAREMAEFWRRAAASSDDEAEAEGLRNGAARSDVLGMLAGRLWPVSDPFGALEHIELCARSRTADVDNPDLKFDLRAYFARAEFACGAAALALGDEVDGDAGGLFYKPVAFFDPEFDAGLQADWLFHAGVWHNLMSDQPVAYAEAIQSQ
jgi:hypothetical protein